MFYYLYEITNTINGKIYVGVHKTNNLNDGYMGSGKVIRRAMEKYGAENFTKVILEQFDDSVAMYAREKEVVSASFLLREDVYNLRRGGTGGFDYINKHKLNSTWNNVGKQPGTKAVYFTAEDGRRQQILNKKNKTGAYSANFKNAFKDKLRQADFQSRSQSVAAMVKRKNTFAESRHQQGEKNSQFGMMWITNDIKDKKIRKTDSIPDGFRKGKKYNPQQVEFCPHCHKEGAGSNMKRYHFNNCKQNG